MFNRTRYPITAVAVSTAAIAVLSVWILGWTAGPAYGHPGGRGAGMDAGWDGGQRLERMTRRLDLSDAQRESIAAILKDARAEGETLRTELTALRESVRGAVQSDEFYADQVRIEIESKAPLMVDLMMLGAQTMHAVRAELTPEQQAEADAMFERFKDGRRRHGMFGRQRD